MEDGGEALLEKLSLDPLLDHLRGLGRLGLSILCGTREGCGISRSVCGISDVAGNGCSGHRDARFGAGERGGTHRRGLTLSHVYLARRDTSEVRIQRGLWRGRAAVLDEGGLRRQQTALRAKKSAVGDLAVTMTCIAFMHEKSVRSL